MALQPGTNRQVPDHSIVDAFNKQTYLGNQFISSASQTSAGSSETTLFLLSNPAVSATSFPAGYTSLFVNFIKIACITASQGATLRVYLSPTVSAAGTPATPVNLRPASPTTSIATLTTGPTASPNGTLLFALAAIPGSADAIAPMVILDPGKSLLVTIQATASSTVSVPSLGWFEL